METVAPMTPTARDVAAAEKIAWKWASGARGWTEDERAGWREFADVQEQIQDIAAALARERERAEEVVRRARGRAAAVSPSAVRICDEIAAAIRQPEGPDEGGDARRAEG